MGSLRLTNDLAVEETTQTVCAFDPPSLKRSALKYGIWSQKKDGFGKTTRPEEIVAKLRQVDVLVSQTVRSIGVTAVDAVPVDKFGGLKFDQVKRLKDLERRTSAVARLSLI